MIDPTYFFQRQWEDIDPLTAEINRLQDQVNEMREIISDLISGARRDHSIISRKAGPLHVIETHVTKSQVLRAMGVIKKEQG